MASNTYIDGGVYPFADGSERVWYKSPNEKVRPSGFVTEDEFKQLKASQKASVSDADQSKFNANQIALQSVNQARALLAKRPANYNNREAGLDAGEYTPNWFERAFRSPEGDPDKWGGQMAKALTGLRSPVFMNQITQYTRTSPTGGGASLGNSEKEGERLEGAFGSLAVAQDPKNLAQSLNNVERMVKTWQPGLTTDNPMDLTAGQSRDTAPRGAFYRSPDGATRKNVNGSNGNKILWTPESDPQKAYKDAKLAWNDRWYQKRGNLDGADAAFNQWWASAPADIKTYKKAPPIAPPPRAAQSGGVIQYDQNGNRIR